jgi:hypothetical protein
MSLTLIPCRIFSSDSVSYLRNDTKREMAKLMDQILERNFV